jgi:hypothetical protein
MTSSTPEQRARADIDRLLEQAGPVVQDVAVLNVYFCCVQIHPRQLRRQAGGLPAALTAGLSLPLFESYGGIGWSRGAMSVEFQLFNQVLEPSDPAAHLTLVFVA